MYMNTVVVNVKLEPEVKRDAQEIASKLGLSLSAIIKAYLKELIRTKKVSFSAEEPSDFLISSLNAAEKDIEAGRVSPSFKTADSAITWLKNSR